MAINIKAMLNAEIKALSKIQIGKINIDAPTWRAAITTMAKRQAQLALAQIEAGKYDELTDFNFLMMKLSQAEMKRLKRKPKPKRASASKKRSKK